MNSYKKIILFFIGTVFLLTACKKKVEKRSDDSRETIIEIDKNGSSSDTIKDCEDFLNQYEEWANTYISFMEKFKENPVAMMSSPEYAKMMTKASEWSTQIGVIATSCSTTTKYQERMEEIGDKLEERIKKIN